MPVPLLQETENDGTTRTVIVQDEVIVPESLKGQLITLDDEICGMADSGKDALSLVDFRYSALVMM